MWFQVDVKDGKSTDICLDCKDKVVKFYHFKRKVQDVQKRKSFRPAREKPRQKMKSSKVVHNIVQIVESYTDKCSVSSIRVDQTNRKLVIEPKIPQSTHQQTPEHHSKPATETRKTKQKQQPEQAEDDDDNQLLDEMFVETPQFDTSEELMQDPVNIKQEQVFGEPINYIEEQDEMDDDQNGNDDDDDDYQDTDFSYNYGASTSSQAKPPAKKRKFDPKDAKQTEGEH